MKHDTGPAASGPSLGTQLATGMAVTAEHQRVASPDADRAALTAPDWHAMVACVAEEQENGAAVQPGMATTQEFDQAATRLADYLHTRPGLLRALVHSPHLLLDPQSDALPGHWPPARRWRVLAACADTVWAYLERTAPTHSHHRRLLPLAARSRFLALSYPFRFRAGSPPDWGKDELTRQTELVFGRNSGAELVRRANEARQAWAAYLDTYQSHPVLAEAASHDLEEEVAALAFRAGPRSGPLVLSAHRLDEAVLPRAEDVALVDHVLQEHLLPRFSMGAVLESLFLARDHFRPRFWAFLAGAAVVCAVLTPVTVAVLWFAPFADIGPYPWAAVPAALTYLFIGVGVYLYGRQWAMPWLLRLPAASAVGLIVLVALHFDWWQGEGPKWPAVLVLAAASLWYLSVEARNHGVGPVDTYRVDGDASRPQPRWWTTLWRSLTVAGRWTALRRALAVAFIGIAHALLVSVIGTMAILPAFSEEGSALTTVWSGPASDLWTPLFNATTWCLAAGVFSQILWDDQPITASLAHRRWKHGR
ncbi:hypothetical protein DFP74_2664 [Nocardiopsis sp. Huas11]|uniref:hypothetical protein n=1 Tax=Nocardiopsis sp. Huas11 TaxID=2183912 RepID=UPI000EAC4E3A|nr:hypothetical protein [Nocardiopsis sp. Huas11]RKS07013.1 hypothetical protein DFP74_2664 [Nocardiopsis sp. Huas11]